MRYANAQEEKMGLLPIMNPLFNLREICKQMSLLEDHLNNPRKRCRDCIRKHFLTIEALFEEAVSLDKEFKYGEHLDGKAQEIRDLQGEWLDCLESAKEHDCHLAIAQGLRAMRKGFAPLCFDVRKMASIERSARNMRCDHAEYRRAIRHVMATKSESEREDKDIEGLVKKSPKKKPPRKDLERTRMRQQDPDLQGLGRGHKGDPDFKRKD